MNRNNSRHSDARSASRHRHRADSHPGHHHPDAQFTSFDIVRLIISTKAGSLELRNLRNFLFRDVDPSSNAKFELVWKHLLQHKDNFILSDPLKDVKTLNGNETATVHTVLTLCKTHISGGKNGRNRTCEGDCGALHICRTFLLCSENACPFNSKKKKCMFGHRFATHHNSELLKAHNLYGLDDSELQKLFRWRLSRSASTLPQLCIYYNKADGKKCSRENCKSLHLCKDFVQQCCDGNCSRNHKLSTSQVRRVLDLFAIDSSWSSEMLLEDLQHFMTARHQHVTDSNSSGEDSDASESSQPGGHVAEGPDRLASLVNVDTSDPSSSITGMSQTCAGCEDLKKEIAKMQLKISWLTSQVLDLTGLKNPLNEGQARPSATAPSTSSQALSRPQPFSYYTSNPPNSSLFK